ncbi:MAG TPA: leucine--tRNA ligase [Edaphocola sp.]|nr:leucine--tRNA ligase [Edaphocola sp.]
MKYDFNAIEQKWNTYWKENNTYKVENTFEKPKYYVLDMFPYPSGAGLHVGHPLGYIATDIYSRYKRMKGFNVLHPMGFDAFGLPAEQYALETGQHPAVTTEINIKRYKEQLDNIGFNYDWSREVRTCDPKYYKWTQWIFSKLFHSWLNPDSNKAVPIATLIAIFEKQGNAALLKDKVSPFSATEWKSFDEAHQRNILMQYRLAYLDEAEVWWCEALNTVLANDEVVNGVSERGGFPVEKKKLSQWFLRITDYADRLLESLNDLDWTDAMKEMQRNWIGRSEGASVSFQLKDSDRKIEVFTTRPDTIFGVDFMVLAPELDYIESICSQEQLAEVQKYIQYVKSRSERERMAEKKISGCFTGAFAIHPFSGKQIPVWISEYVLSGYGTGAIMAVPSGDDRDFAFAKHFNIEITNIFGNQFNGESAYSSKDGIIENSEFITGKSIKEATSLMLKAIEEKGIGKAKINYKFRDAGFSRQRYWGEPFPIVYKNNIPYTLDEKQINLKESDQSLPVLLPHVEHYGPGPNGQGPLANIADFVNIQNADGEILLRETNTMPGYAGSSWYFLRYMSPEDNEHFVAEEACKYWQAVDLYVGGTEHAVGHLLYSRFWTKVLFDLGYLYFQEPFKRLLNQGMIQGSSRFVYRKKENRNEFVSAGLINQFETDAIHVDVNLVDGTVLNIEAFRKWRPEFEKANFTLEEGKFICGVETEKMSKSKYNVVNPDIIVKEYGADTFRMYEMFLGPIEMSKPWDTKGIEGVHRFLKKLWRLFFDEITEQSLITNEEPTKAELKILHQSIKKITEDIEKFSFNTSVAQFMILTNELTNLKCHKHSILSQVVQLINPFAPHIAEELWHQLGNSDSINDSVFPIFEEQYIGETEKVYPVAINGKHRTNITFSLTAEAAEIEPVVLENEIVQKWLEGKTPKKIIFVKGKMINVIL